MNSVKMTLLSMSSCRSVDSVPAGVREVMGSIPVGNSDFSLSHARFMWINSPFNIFPVYLNSYKLGNPTCLAHVLFYVT